MTLNEIRNWRYVSSSRIWAIVQSPLLEMPRAETSLIPTKRHRQWLSCADPVGQVGRALGWCVEQQEARQGFGRKVCSGSVTVCDGGGVPCSVQQELLPPNLLKKCKEIFVWA